MRSQDDLSLSRKEGRALHAGRWSLEARAFEHRITAALIDIVPETPARHAEAIEALYDRTFGPGHFAKTAERLREFSTSLPDLTRIAVVNDSVVGVCRIWPLRVETGPSAVFVGPVAVDPNYRGQKLSIDVTRAALDASRSAGWGAAILIGALSLFGEAGFVPAHSSRLVLPGPVDPTRLLIADLTAKAAALSGRVNAPRVARPIARSQAPE
ncbi:MAG: N-acetyltransferase [Pseudomonadota bacterium]